MYIIALVTIIAVILVGVIIKFAPDEFIEFFRLEDVLWSQMAAYKTVFQ